MGALSRINLSASKVSVVVGGRLFKELQKFISHKYANGLISYTMIYVQAAILGPLQKISYHKYAKDVISNTMKYVQTVI